MCEALSKEAARMRESKAAGSKLVPHALQLMRANEALSTGRVAVGGPNVFIVSVTTGRERHPGRRPPVHGRRCAVPQGLGI